MLWSYGGAWKEALEEATRGKGKRPPPQGDGLVAVLRAEEDAGESGD